MRTFIDTFKERFPNFVTGMLFDLATFLSKIGYSGNLVDAGDRRNSIITEFGRILNGAGVPNQNVDITIRDFCNLVKNEFFNRKGSNVKDTSQFEIVHSLINLYGEYYNSSNQLVNEARFIDNIVNDNSVGGIMNNNQNLREEEKVINSAIDTIVASSVANEIIGNFQHQQEEQKSVNVVNGAVNEVMRNNQQNNPLHLQEEAKVRHSGNAIRISNHIIMQGVRDGIRNTQAKEEEKKRERNNSLTHSVLSHLFNNKDQNKKDKDGNSNVKKYHK